MTETKQEVIDDIKRRGMDDLKLGESYGFKRKIAHGKELVAIANRYDDALPDNIAKLPEIVSKEIQEDRKYNLGTVLHFASELEMPNKKAGDWIANHEETFARAWIDGVWIVQETGEVVRV